MGTTEGLGPGISTKKRLQPRRWQRHSNLSHRRPPLPPELQAHAQETLTDEQQVIAVRSLARIRDTLYAALTDSLFLEPELDQLLRTNKPRALGGLVSLTMARVALEQVRHDEEGIPVIFMADRKKLHRNECPGRLQRTFDVLTTLHHPMSCLNGLDEMALREQLVDAESSETPASREVMRLATVLTAATERLMRDSEFVESTERLFFERDSSVRINRRQALAKRRLFANQACKLDVRKSFCKALQFGS